MSYQISAVIFSQNHVFGTQPMLRLIRKDLLPIHYISSIIYQFRCQCYADYVGRTGQRLEPVINQQTLANISKVDNLHGCVNVSGIVIAENLLKIQQCARFYSSDMFSVPSKTNLNYYLKVVKLVYISL